MSKPKPLRLWQWLCVFGASSRGSERLNQNCAFLGGLSTGRSKPSTQQTSPRTSRRLRSWRRLLVRRRRRADCDGLARNGAWRRTGATDRLCVDRCPRRVGWEALQPGFKISIQASIPPTEIARKSRSAASLACPEAAPTSARFRRRARPRPEEGASDASVRAPMVSGFSPCMWLCRCRTHHL